MMNPASGWRRMSATPPRFASGFSSSPAIAIRSCAGRRSIWPSSRRRRISCRRSIRSDMVRQFVSRPPSQRWLTYGMPTRFASFSTASCAQDAVENEAKRVGMPYVNHRWLGGLLTNWRTMSDRIERLHEMRRLRDEGQMDLLPAQERIAMAGELEKPEANLGGVADMRRQPDAVFIIDLKKEALAVSEARRLNLPVIALVDTNCDPDEADFVVPGNDDAIRACALITRVIANAIAEGQQKASVKDFQKPQKNGAAPAPAAEGDAEAAPEAEPEPEQTPEPAAEEPAAEEVQ